MPAHEVTFRLSISNPESTDMDSLQQSLEKEGFQVAPDGRRGFLLTCGAELAERFFHARIEVTENESNFLEEPSNDDVLSDVEFRAYFPSKPDYFP